MDAREYLDKFGRDRAQKTAEKAGTNLAYFEQLACGFRRPSYELAERLVAADDELALDTRSLMEAKARIARERAAQSDPQSNARANA